MPADKENFVELLAPARDCGVAREAILAGADAVYIGASDFGARAAAANRLDDISQLCKFAHVFGCKVYVALNTILTDAELPRAEDLARKLCEIGVDALIVQDMGLACRLARFLPMPLHARRKKPSFLILSDLRLLFLPGSFPFRKSVKYPGR